MKQIRASLFLLVAGQLTCHTVPAAAAPPRPSHVVIVIEENHSFNQILGTTDDIGNAKPGDGVSYRNNAGYFVDLATMGVSFTNAHGETHPSQPNYIALFSGGTQGITGDECTADHIKCNGQACPATISAPSLAGQLIGTGLSFKAYAEGYDPSSNSCQVGDYAAKHCPWTSFVDIQHDHAYLVKPFTDFSKSSFANLPDVAFVMPNLKHDMHDGKDPGRITAAANWLSSNLKPYVDWAMANNSLLIVTWDENQGNLKTDKADNQIPTLFIGPMLHSGSQSDRIDHYAILRAVEDMFGLPYLGKAASAPAIWSKITQP